MNAEPINTPASMTLTEIKTAVGSIKHLPAEEKMEAENMAYQELGVETFGDKVCADIASGKFEAMIARADEAYERGEALDRFC